MRFLTKCVAGGFIVGMTLSNLALADYAAAVLADGPIAYYSLDEVAGGDGTIAANQGSLGTDAEGEFFGDEFEADPGPGLPGFGAGNMAIRLTRLNEDGAATPIDEASGVTVNEPILDDLRAFTLSGWINPTEADLSNRAGIFGQDNAIEFGFIGASNIQMWAELPGGGDVHINSLYEFDNDEWHHIAIVGDGIDTGELAFYVDGEEQEWQENNSMLLDDLGKDSYGVSGNPFNIGGGAIYGADRQYAGAIDEVAVFDKALTAEQIMAHYVCGATGDCGDVGVVGDFNNSGARDTGDLDLMALGAIDDATFDLDGDGDNDIDDRKTWVESLSNTFIGDSNFDGQFNSSDFVAVFTTAKYETDQDATWAEGDWNGDTKFNSSDFVAAFQGQGYEKGPREGGLMVVPEPSAIVLIGIGLLAFTSRRRR